MVRSCSAVASLTPPAVLCWLPRCALTGLARRRSFVGAPCCTCRQLWTWSARERTVNSCSGRAAASCSSGRAGPPPNSRVAREGMLLRVASRISRSRLPGDCETLGAPSSETMSSRSMPTRRRASFGSAGPGRQSGSSTSPLMRSLPVSPSTWWAGSAFASWSRRLSPVRRLSTGSTASAAVEGWHGRTPR